MLACVSLPTLLSRCFSSSAAFHIIALNLMSYSLRTFSRNERESKRRQYISGVSASTLFLVVCLPQCHEIESTVLAMLTNSSVILYISFLRRPRGHPA